MAERQSAAGAKGYKRLCDVIVLAPIVHMDSDDRERYSVICTHQTRGVLGAAAFTALTVLARGRESCRAFHWLQTVLYKVANFSIALYRR